MDQTYTKTDTTTSVTETPKSKFRCYVCNKKIKMIEQPICKCRCEQVFCQAHIFPGKLNSENCHACTFDYFGFNKDMLSKQNPHITSIRVEKI